MAEVTMIGLFHAVSSAPVTWPDGPIGPCGPPYGPRKGPPPKYWPAVSFDSLNVSHWAGFMMIALGSRKLEPLVPLIALNKPSPKREPAKVFVLIPERPAMPTSELVPPPRTSWNSSWILTNN